MALCTFVFTHYLGIKYHGVKYIKHFLGPIPALAPLFFPIEIIGHTRPGPLPDLASLRQYHG